MNDDFFNGALCALIMMVIILCIGGVI